MSNNRHTEHIVSLVLVTIFSSIATIYPEDRAGARTIKVTVGRRFGSGRGETRTSVTLSKTGCDLGAESCTGKLDNGVFCLS
ncbi:MAG: hypothetical protein J7J98_05700 [candidate division Zixibacteria bacterium]|nr:hypothetical protein [candidate division Zixibacteria bacterium]